MELLMIPNTDPVSKSLLNNYKCLRALKNMGVDISDSANWSNDKMLKMIKIASLLKE